MLDGGDWPRGGPMWRSGPRQIFFFLKHPPTVRSLGSALGVGRVALHRTGGRSAAAFRPSLRSRRNAAVDRPPVRCSATRPPPRADPRIAGASLQAQEEKVSDSFILFFLIYLLCSRKREMFTKVTSFLFFLELMLICLGYLPFSYFL